MTGFANGTISDSIINGIFFRVCTKPAIKNNNDPAIVLVDIITIGTLMGAVIGWAIKNVFDPFWELTHSFGMNKKLIN
ncbi:hypothetical protein [Psychrobacter sp. 72-O-c]|uniref:hypothetical protein n=1 Tax=Psychrobacter sp. 72-O-c TaxID=2774125 RepID=UPI001918E6FC|nr:hypothetical protein [Psychrobacter sp. 72-O-c]